MLFNLDNGKKNKNKNLHRLIKYVYRWEFKKKYCPPEALKPSISVLDGWKKTNSP